jgi:hypothetical protein
MSAIASAGERQRRQRLCEVVAWKDEEPGEVEGVSWPQAYAAPCRVQWAPALTVVSFSTTPMIAVPGLMSR